MLRSTLLIAAFGATTSLLFAETPASEPAPISTIDCAVLLNPTSGKVTSQQRLVVQAGKVLRIEAASGAADGFCMPGFIDLHTHLTTTFTQQSYSEGFRLNPADNAYRAQANAMKTVRAGFTTVRDLGDSDNVSVSLRNAIQQGLVVGPRIYTSTKGIGSTGGHADPTNGTNAKLMGDPGPKEGVVNSPSDGRKAVRQRYKDSADWVKITATGGVLSYAKSPDAPQFTVAEVRAIVATAKDYGLKVAAHAHGAEGMRRAVEGGVATIEHGTYITPEIIKLMKQNGTVLIPTLAAGRWVGLKSKEVGYYPDIVRPKAALVGALLQQSFAKAYAAGVPWAFGTDTGVSPHGSNAEEFLLLEQAGVPRLEALRGATLYAARVLDEEARLGCLNAGCFADVVVLPGNPLDDLSHTLKPQAVYVGGTRVAAN
jgi:imidazolonepropionase-like amidohydrolase